MTNPMYIPGPGDRVTWPYDPADYDDEPPPFALWSRKAQLNWFKHASRFDLIERIDELLEIIEGQR